VKDHLKDEGFDPNNPTDAALNRAGQWILSPRENIRKGLNIFLEYIEKKDGSLSAASKKYSGEWYTITNQICPPLDKDEKWW